MLWYHEEVGGSIAEEGFGKEYQKKMKKVWYVYYAKGKMCL